MKAKAKLAVQWLKTCLDTLSSLVYVVVFSRLPGGEQKRSSTPECIVLGNGPSLQKDIGLNPRIGNGRDIVCVNDFVFSDLYQQLQPKHYIVSDPHYWVPNTLPEIAANRERFFTEFLAKTIWSVQLFVPFECKHSARWKELKLNEHPHIQVRYFNRTPVGGFEWSRHLIYRLNLGMPLAQNVLVAALFITLNQGYKRIYMLGADHSWHQEIIVDNNNRVYLRQKHFYDQDQENVAAEPVYQSNNDLFTMKELFAAWSRVHAGYEVIERYSKNREAHIYNATSNSFVDAFERVDVKEIQLHPADSLARLL